MIACLILLSFVVQEHQDSVLHILDLTPSPLEISLSAPTPELRVLMLSRVEANMRLLQRRSNADLLVALAHLKARSMGKFATELRTLYPKIGTESDDNYRNRIGVKAYYDAYKCFLITRYLFDVPERDKWDEFSFSSMEGIRDKDGYRTPMLPFHRLSDGTTDFVGDFYERFDSPYLPLDEFKAYAARYKRRPKWWR